MHHFVAIGEFKLQLQSGKAQSGSNSTIFRAVRPWNLTDDLAKQYGIFYATSSFVYHFIPVFKISAGPRTLTGKIWVGPASFPSLSYINFRKIVLRSGKFQILFWRLSYPLVILNLSYSPETPNLGQMRQYFEPCDLEIWRMTLKNNRAPLLCYFKLCAAFRTHWWIQTGVTVRKRPIWVKFDVF